MTHRVFLIAIPALAVIGLATSTLARDGNQRILTPVAGLCAKTVDDMAQWARVTEGFGAFAVPTDPNVTSCDDPDIRQVTAGTSSNAPSMEAARAVALSLCEAARGDDFDACLVIGMARSE